MAADAIMPRVPTLPDLAVSGRCIALHNTRLDLPGARKAKRRAAAGDGESATEVGPLATVEYHVIAVNKAREGWASKTVRAVL